MATAAEEQDLLAFQASLKRKLRYLGSFFSIVLIITGIYLLLNGMIALVTKPAPTIDKEAAIFDTTPTPVVLDSLIDNSKGQILDGISTQRVNAATVTAETKAQQTALRIAKTGRWQATNYAKGDIGIGVYEVKQGDTLWEIAEAVYGNGNQWGKILERNKETIGKLPNGSQALIVPGQKLDLYI